MAKQVHCEECSKVFTVTAWQKRPYFYEEAQERAASDDWERYR